MCFRETAYEISPTSPAEIERAVMALSRGIRSGLKVLSHAEAARSGKFLFLSPIESRLGLGALSSVLNPDVGFLLGHFWF
ncbi:hypothetical protein MUK42_14393 [Musa troglodytarum]|uniref:Uncharacterized protein n=1 Tax=Musa troglodytarum TaxID=320322 RepID=A0A9E7I1P0_9LILI|nr:hypothetical protein MUK42_14393 [Musa troglodytarum]